MKNTELTNLTITKRAGSFGDYFLIYDNDNNETYFIFKNKLKNIYLGVKREREDDDYENDKNYKKFLVIYFFSLW